MKWEHLFKSRILERGYDYYTSGAVTELETDKDAVYATVCGAEDYEVEIHLNNDKIDYMYCSCPYAADDNNCKHMAAVLYAYEEKDSYEPASDIEKTVNAADEAFVRRFLISALQKDEKLCSRFTLALSAPDDFDINYYKNWVNEIVDYHSDDGGYINYHDAYYFYEEISGLLSSEAAHLIENKRFDDALELSLFMIEFLGELDIDDSDGYITSLLYICEEILRDIIDECGEGTKEKAFKKILKSVQKSPYDFVKSCFNNFLMSNFKEKKFFDDKLAYFDEMIEFYDKSDSYYREYSVSEYLIARLKLMKEMCGDDEIEMFCRKYWSYSDVRRFLTDKYIEEEKYQDAITILIESLKMDKDYKGLVIEHLDKLKELYKITNDYDNYLNTLWQIVFESFDLSYYKELKEQYTEKEWEEKRERVFKAIKSFYQKAELFYMEGLYDRLLECAIPCNGLDIVRRYKDVLVPLFPRKILDKYTDEVKKEAAIASNRAIYKSIVSVLREMRELPQGEERVQEIVSDWKEKYCRRRAMMEELKEL